MFAELSITLHQRIQASEVDCPGRNPDMSPEAAAAMRKVLASIPNQRGRIHPSIREAAQMLMSNRERVVLDITNPGPKNIEGKPLTQMELKRVDQRSRVSVDAMIGEVCCRLLGRKMSKPSTPEEARVWAEAARYLSGRIQGTPDEKPGRNPDMSSGASTAMRAVLASVASLEGDTVVDAEPWFLLHTSRRQSHSLRETTRKGALAGLTHTVIFAQTML